MKKMYRIAWLCLCLALLLGMTSCVQIGSEDEEVPEGMQIASASGADFRLYVPTTWVVNVAYGVSGAYRDLTRQSTVSMTKYPITEAWSTALEALTAESTENEGNGISAIAPRLRWFFENECLRPVRETALDHAVTLDEPNCGTDILDQTEAGRWCYSALVNGKTYRYQQLVTEREGAFYVFTFTAESEMYEQYLGDVEKMLDAFCFAEPYVPRDYSKHLDDGADAPSGMKPCFGADVAYRFYVPSDWEIDLDSPVYAAWFPGDRASVSVVPYMPNTEQMSVAEFFTMSHEQMVKLYGEGAMQVDEAKTHKEKLGEREATVYEYTCTIGGRVYRYRQYIAAYRSMLYSLTYTATPEAFDGHLDEVARMVAAFSFR